MTYRLEPVIGKIVCPVMLVFPDGSRKDYSSGTKACEAAFDHKYVVDEISAINNSIEMVLTEVDSLNGDETFF